jgi:metal-responsive CopG/Arc/MetJ family transcriptional regulator
MVAKKILVSIDERLLVQVDRAARRRGLSRSAYIQRLAAADLVTEKGPGTDPSVRAAFASVRSLFRRNPVPDEDFTETVRRMRDER